MILRRIPWVSANKQHKLIASLTQKHIQSKQTKLHLCQASVEWVIGHFNNNLYAHSDYQQTFQACCLRKRGLERKGLQGGAGAVGEFKTSTAAITGCQKICLIENDLCPRKSRSSQGLGRKSNCPT